MWAVCARLTAILLLCVLILLYMCPHTTICVSSYCYICVLILLYVWAARTALLLLFVLILLLCVLVLLYLWGPHPRNCIIRLHTLHTLALSLTHSLSLSRYTLYTCDMVHTHTHTHTQGQIVFLIQSHLISSHLIESNRIE